MTLTTSPMATSGRLPTELSKAIKPSRRVGRRVLLAPEHPRCEHAVEEGLNEGRSKEMPNSNRSNCDAGFVMRQIRHFS